MNKEKLLIFFISHLLVLFIGPIIFILVSNKSCVFYHFINFIILNGFLYIIIFIILVIEKLLRIKLNFPSKFFSILFLAIIFGYQNWVNVKKIMIFRHIKIIEKNFRMLQILLKKIIT